MMKIKNRFVASAIFGGILGLVLGIFGIYVTMWQFYAIAIPMNIAFNLLTQENKKNET